MRPRARHSVFVVFVICDLCSVFCDVFVVFFGDNPLARALLGSNRIGRVAAPPTTSWP